MFLVDNILSGALNCKTEGCSLKDDFHGCFRTDRQNMPLAEIRAWIRHIMHFLFRVGCRAFEKFYFTLLYFSRQTIDSPRKVDYDSCLAAVYLKPLQIYTHVWFIFYVCIPCVEQNN